MTTTPVIIVQRSVDLVKLKAAIFRESQHFPDEWFKMFLMQCNKDAGGLFMKFFVVVFVTYRYKCFAENCR